MAYTTIEDIKAAGGYGFLAALTANDVSLSEATIVAAAIAWASGKIDGWIGARYDVQFTTVPSVISQCATDGACYYLVFHGPAGVKSSEGESWERRWTEWQDWLKAVADGKASIPGGALASSSGGMADNFDDLNRSFTNDRLSGGDSLVNFLKSRNQRQASSE